VIFSFYQRFLSRAADSGGLGFWTARLQQGAADEVVIAGFLALDEFFAQL
jgi:hypothetical protein